MCTLRRNALFHCLLYGIQIKQLGFCQHSAQQNHVCRTIQTVFGCHIGCRQRNRFHVIPYGFFLYHRVIQQNQAVRLHCMDKLGIRRAIHGNQTIRSSYQRRTNRFIGNTDGTVCRAATHFRTIRRQPRQFFSCHQSAVCQNFSGEQNALSTKTS